MGCIYKETGRLINAALFDMDGVLVDSIPLHINSWNKVFSEMSLPEMTNEQFFNALGQTNAEMLVDYCDQNRVGLSESEMVQVLSRKEAAFRKELVAESRTTPGVEAWLSYFNQHDVLCAVASSGTMANLTLALSKLNIADHFSSIICGMKIPASKPDPQIFLMAASSLDVPARECLVIEDAPMGIQAAKAADMLCCAITTSYCKEDLEDADIILESLVEVNPGQLFFNQERKK